MTTESEHKRSTMITTDVDVFTHSFAKDVDQGLSGNPKTIPSMYFYDQKGSLLFEDICQLSEYYLTRAETEILENSAKDILAQLPDDILLVELGSGSAIKTELIIEELLNQYDKVHYSPIDISKSMLEQSSMSLLKKYQNLRITSVAAEYEEGMRQLDMHKDQTKLVLWLGSSIGNLEHGEAVNFISGIVQHLSPNDFFLIGFDLQKQADILEKAYNDSQNKTAEFNLNLLTRINRELGGSFEPDTFRHQAVYNPEIGRIEMYLTSLCEQSVYISDLKKQFHFAKGEKIHTENSHKFSLPLIKDLADRSGLEIVDQWFDTKRYFNLTLFKLKVSRH